MRKEGCIVGKVYDEGSILWIADLEVQKFLKEREIEHLKKALYAECGFSNNNVDVCFLEQLKNAHYDLIEIQEELELANKKRAEYLKKHPTQTFFSKYGCLIEETDNER